MNNKIIYDVAIIGGGMAGMTAAACLSEKGLKVCLIERNDKIGKKVALTGNGKCNLTNNNMSHTKYVSSNDGYINEKLPKLIKKYSIDREQEFYRTLGLYTKEKNGYVYPVSNQASTVVNVFINYLNKNGVLVILNEYVTDVRKEKDIFCICNNQGSIVYSRKLIIATGGKAGVYKEKEYNGFSIIKKAGHKVTKLYPGLVQTICEEKEFFKEVSGVRVDAKATLYIDNEEICYDTGEIQMTDKGLSGIPIFQLSRYIGGALASGKKVYIKLDYLPNYSKEIIKRDILNRYKTDCDKLSMVNNEENKNKLMAADVLFDGLLNKKLETALLKRAHLSPTKPMKEGLTEKIMKFLSLIKEDEIKVIGINDFDKAQISVGGAELSEIKNSFESVKSEGLYIVGEALDVSGECGGYNLHFAWLSAMAAAEDISDKLSTNQ